MCHVTEWEKIIQRTNVFLNLRNTIHHLTVLIYSCVVRKSENIWKTETKQPGNSKCVLSQRHVFIKFWILATPRPEFNCVGKKNHRCTCTQDISTGNFWQSALQNSYNWTRGGNWSLQWSVLTVFFELTTVRKDLSFEQYLRHQEAGR